MKRTGWIIYNGFLTGDKFSDFAQMLHDAAQQYGHQTKMLKNNEIISLLHESIAMLNTTPSDLPDYVIFTDKDIYLAKQLELLGIPVFNSAAAIETSDDKVKTYQALAAENIAIPQTIIAPKTYGLNEQYDINYLKLITEQLHFPLVVKEAFGSFGEQVYLVHNEKELQALVLQIHDRPFVFQQFIKTSYGKDLRLQVVGDKVVTAMQRISKNDFRANVTSGGRMEMYQPSHAEMSIAIAATKAVKADFAGVDLLFGENDTPIVCEVNSNAHIRNLLDCTGINAAHDIIKYIDTKLEQITC